MPFRPAGNPWDLAVQQLATIRRPQSLPAGLWETVEDSIAQSLPPSHAIYSPVNLEQMATMKNPPIATHLRKFVRALRSPNLTLRRRTESRDLLHLMRENIDNFFLRVQEPAQFEQRSAFYDRMAAWLRAQHLREMVAQCAICRTIVLHTERNAVPLWDAVRLFGAGEQQTGYVCSRCESHLMQAGTHIRSASTERSIVERSTQVEGSILNYGFDATTITTPLKAAGEKNPVLLGVELECVVRSNHVSELWGANEVARDFRTVAPWLITKSDGSIAGAGFEIVTAPMSLKVHQHLWSAMFETDLMGKIRNDPSCGLHVHLSKKNISALTMGKMFYFCNHSTNQTLIQAVAGRQATTYARFNEALPMAQGAFQTTDKYSVLNTQKQATVELRIGASTTNKRELLARIEFAHAIWNFCRTAPAIRASLSSYRFCRFVFDNANTYLFLNRELRILLMSLAALRLIRTQLENAGISCCPKPLTLHPVTIAA